MTVPSSSNRVVFRVPACALAADKVSRPISPNRWYWPDSKIRGPQLGSQIGPSEDMFEVYLGGMDYPLDAPPIWRYTAKNALNGPSCRSRAIPEGD